MTGEEIFEDEANASEVATAVTTAEFINKAQEAGNMEAGTVDKLQCSCCHKLIHRASMARHVTNQHGDKQNSQVVCDVCRKCFKNEASVKQHKRRTHKVFQLTRTIVKPASRGSPGAAPAPALDLSEEIEELDCRDSSIEEIVESSIEEIMDH